MKWKKIHMSVEIGAATLLDPKVFTRSQIPYLTIWLLKQGMLSIFIDHCIPSASKIASFGEEIGR